MLIHGEREKNPNWKGGRVYRDGYVYIFKLEHPNSVCGGYVLEHRLKMEEKLGRLLEGWEQIHHINGIKDDNRIENLEMTTSNGHFGIHKPWINSKRSTKFVVIEEVLDNKNYTTMTELIEKIKSRFNIKNDDTARKRIKENIDKLETKVDFNRRMVKLKC